MSGGSLSLLRSLSLSRCLLYVWEEEPKEEGVVVGRGWRAEDEGGGGIVDKMRGNGGEVKINTRHEESGRSTIVNGE